MYKHIIVLAFTLIISMSVKAQDIVTVCGEYIYYPPENVSIAEAKQIALQRARLEGLIKEFNQTVYQTNTSVISNHNGESTSDFYSFGGTDARGEWIEDTKAPQYEIFCDQEMIAVKTSVCGTAREIVSAGVQIDAKVLRNGITTRNESSDFNSGDDMFMYFHSPIPGYLLVYLLERDIQMVYCLLPYKNSTKPNVYVEGDKDYVFFKRDHSIEGWEDVDEYTLGTENNVEYNDIYIVFSPKPFYKVSTKVSEDKRLPKELTFKDFEKWLVQCRKNDPEMVVEKRLIKITKK